MRTKNTTGKPEKSRGAGVLLHVTSLPGDFGTGDIGPEAKQFAVSLRQAGQRYWQLLPLNPTSHAAGYSPYSSVSSIAGNTLLISPEGLVEKRLLRSNEIDQYRMSSTSRADFAQAERIRSVLLDEAYRRFISGRNTTMKEGFTAFRRSEKNWLDDFALYVLLKTLHDDKPWYEWHKRYRDRDTVAMKEISRKHRDDLNRISWMQYIFFQQWNDLKKHCNRLGVHLFGDLPFYVSHDSADVWAERKNFSLTRDGRPKLVAGVPPDYFNENGQFWGMPVFDWRSLKKNRYTWWLRRLSKNLAMYDLLRLDHFRAFADYWAVPASEKTAKKGTWKPGPGEELFQLFESAYGDLPFVAEDLGDINEDVRHLRDALGFPGMKVLHFAFGGNMSDNEYIPHNYASNFVVYTGTHDNNTTRGWFRKDAGLAERSNLQRYFGDVRVTDRNIHTLLIRLAYSSVAKIAIVPVQDLLGLDEKARFNAPATLQNNWVWRMQPGEFKETVIHWLRAQTEIFGR
jgi:4-alpha-glucanotransferase